MPSPAGSCATGPERRSDAAGQPSSNRDRKKWEAAELFVLPAAQQTLEETCSTINGRCKFSIYKAGMEAPVLVPSLEYRGLSWPFLLPILCCTPATSAYFLMETEHSGMNCINCFTVYARNRYDFPSVVSLLNLVCSVFTSQIVNCVHRCILGYLLPSQEENKPVSKGRYCSKAPVFSLFLF